MKERLLKAYFMDGRHVGRVDDLADLAAEIGLDRDEAVRVLEANEYLPAVKADVALANAYGIQGVPFFVIDGRYGISGAQDSSVFAGALAKVRDERTADAGSAGAGSADAGSDSAGSDNAGSDNAGVSE